MSKLKSFWNKKNLLGNLYKLYPNYNFNIIVEKTGNHYILLWNKNKENINNTNLYTIKEKSTEIFNKIQNLKKELKISPNKILPFISVENTNNCLGNKYNNISFPKQERYSNADLIVKELIDMLVSLGNGNNILKGSTSAYLCYNIGDRIPYNINFSSTYKLIYNNIASIINYCNMNGLYYTTNLNVETYNIQNKENKIRSYIKIQNIITITFDNWVELYKNNEIVVINNVPTYTLESLIQSKKNKMNNNKFSHINQSKEYEMLLLYEQKLKEMKNEENKK